VAQLLEAIVRFRARSHYEAPLVLGTMSRRHGGPMLGHLSHQTGRDLDVRLPLKGNMPATFEVTPRRVDWLAVWHLVGALADTGAVAAVFLDYEAQKLIDKAARKSGASAEERRRVLQYPHGAKAGGLVRHSPGHEAHMHIRFTCGALEPECVGSDQDPAD
jgi:murein endopeptidase